MIEDPKQYILTEDTPSILRRIGLNYDQAKSLEDPTLAYLRGIQEIVSSAIGQDILVRAYREDQIELRLAQRVGNILTEDPQAVCICLDRFLLSSLETNTDVSSRVQRFSICRTVDNQKTPRQKGESFAQQACRLKRLFPDINDRSVVLVDDGLFTGKTVEAVKELLQEGDITPAKCIVIGFLGQTDKTSPNQDVLEPISNLYEWIDIRDFGPFGGKIYERSKNNRVTSAIPYIYPWSDGASASLDTVPEFFEVSDKLIQKLLQLTTMYEQETEKPVTFRTLLQSGFSFPTDKEKSIPVTLNDRLIPYLTRCRERIREEQSRDIYVFDMDGTLYMLDGEKNGFTGSTLEKRVLENATRFIQQTEGCDLQTALSLVDTGLQDPIGLSAFIRSRYGIDRTTYFENVWNINPENIVQNIESTRRTLEKLKENNPRAKFILLTGAPKVWAKNVLAYLGVEALFESTYTAEQYGRKGEIFAFLSKRYIPSNIISIGDQEETDIVPARECGMRTLQIRGPEDLCQLIQKENI